MLKDHMDGICGHSNMFGGYRDGISPYWEAYVWDWWSWYHVVRQHELVGGHCNMLGGHINGTGCHINMLECYMDGVGAIVICWWPH